MRNPELFWDRIARNYDKRGEKKRASLIETIEYIKPHLEPGDRILDFACGTGEKALGVAGSVRSVHGIDLSPLMIEKASAKAAERRVENARFSRMELFDPALAPGSHDAIMAFYIFHLVEDPDRVLARIHELLRPGGRLICETPCLGDSGVVVRWSIALIGKLGFLPDIRCFRIAELQAMVTRASPFALVEARRVGKSETHLFLVAKKV
jgi:ubiquinone/menaquinone biosynthesis C-methylase UbiE